VTNDERPYAELGISATPSARTSPPLACIPVPLGPECVTAASSLTMNYYTDSALQDIAGAVGSLPDFTGPSKMHATVQRCS
jgi:hypothetical protein